MNMNFKQAKEFLEIALCSPAMLETDEKETKHKLIIALKVFVSNNLKIKQNDIIIIKKPENGFDSCASVEETRGDGKVRIHLYERFVEESDLLEFMFTILHECGHVKLRNDSSRGKIVPEQIVLEHERYKDASYWQRLGADFNYQSSKNELLATTYAYFVMNALIDDYVKRNGENSITIKIKKRLMNDLTRQKRRRHNYNILASAWSKINRMFNIDEGDIFWYKDPFDGVEDTAYKYTKIRRLKDKNIQLHDIQDYLLKVKKNPKFECEKELKTMSKEDLIEKWCDYARVITAEKVGVSPDEIGCLMCDVDDIGFIKLQDKYSQTPLYGYYIFSLEKVETAPIEEIFAEIVEQVNITLKNLDVQENEK